MKILWMQSFIKFNWLIGRLNLTGKMKRLKENLEKIEALLSLYDEIVLHESESGAELHSTALKSMYVKRDILKLIIDTNDLIKILNETKYV